MILLPSLLITAALSATPGQVLRFQDLSDHHLLLEAVFAYGSGGTTVDAYIQTTIDAGANWIDIANFHFTTSSGVRLFNLNSRTPVTSILTPTDGSLSANTCVDGIIGDRLRVKYASTGTYAGGTTLAVYALGGKLQSQSLT